MITTLLHRYWYYTYTGMDQRPPCPFVESCFSRTVPAAATVTNHDSIITVVETITNETFRTEVFIFEIGILDFFYSRDTVRVPI